MNLNSSTSNPAPSDADLRQWLSAAADGDAAALDQARPHWRTSEEARSTWHRYHLIGDVMRSAELARKPAHDAAFLVGLRNRLADEPVLLAPSPSAPAPVATAQRWMAPAAVAAGLVVVAGVLVVTRLSGPAEVTGSVVATVQAPGDVQRVSNGALVSNVQLVGGTLIRDPRLDEFLRAHQSARGGFSAALPGSALRRVEAEGFEGAQR
jgi:sigma-E factor negative regulatory protein RseA